MAETRKITIEITSVDKKPKTEIEKSQNENSEDGISNQKYDPNKDLLNLNEAGTNVVINQAYNQMKNMIVSNVDYAINRHFNLTDDYMGQRTYNIAKGIVSKGYNMAISIQAGFLTGGPMGAAIAASLSIGSTIIEAVKNYDQQNIMLRQMDTQLEYSRQRAGFSLTSGSIGENK